MIHITENIFNDFSTNFYLEKIKNESFTKKDTIVSFGKKNYYNRYKITDSSENEKIAISYLKKLYLIDYELIGVWVNRVDNNSNNDDSFHYDGCDLTMITYLNQNFNGGEFEYINENNSKSVIIPKKNLSIIIDKSIEHRVLPVSNGIRYSLVYFYNQIKKIKKTVL